MVVFQNILPQKKSIKYVIHFLSKYICKGVIDTNFSPDAGNNPGIKRIKPQCVHKLDRVK